MLGKNIYLKNQSKCVSHIPRSEVEGIYVCLVVPSLFCYINVTLNIKWCIIKFYCFRIDWHTVRDFRKDTFNVKTLSYFVGFELYVTQ